MDAVRLLLEETVASTSIPGAAMAVWLDGEEVLHHTVGLARIEPVRPAVSGQVYDLASLTKILATTVVAARLVDAGVLDLDAPVSATLPDVHPGITARHLLSHSSGLPAWAPLYEGHPISEWGTPATREAMLRAARTAELQSAPGERHTYSDLGFLAFLSLCETLAGAPWEALVERHALAPHGAALRWGWEGAAATQDCGVRGEVVEGTVDDLNCAAMGGVSSHAGLFGSAREVARQVDAMRREILAGGTLASFALYRGPGSHRLGFDSISPGYSSTGRFFPQDTIGHLGFTGTSAWTSPSGGLTVVLLTNRVHPADRRDDIRAARPLLHDAVARALGWG